MALKTNKKKALLLLGLIFALAGLAFAERSSYLELFAQALNLVKIHYFKPVEDKELIQGAIKGLLQATDPHSQFLLPEDLKKLREESRGLFYGLGLQISKKPQAAEGGQTTDPSTPARVILAVFKNSPAEKAGLQAGDKLLKINQKDVQDFSQTDFDDFIRKRGAKPLKITVLRTGLKSPLELKIHPSPLAVQSIHSKEIEQGLFYIRIYWFAERTALELQQSLKDQKVQALILDLRGNPGGLFESSISTANLFLSQGLIVHYKSRDPLQGKSFKAQRAGTLPPFPLAVLIDGQSASGSEIVAAALKDHKRAFVVGRTSFGKGSVQRLFSLKNQHGLKLTVGEYQSPSGKSIHKQGVEPDFTVEKLKDKAERSKPQPLPDPDILKAVAVLKELMLKKVKPQTQI